MDLMTKKTYKAWTSREHDRLMTMRENRLPITEVAKALGRTVSSVNNRLAKMKMQEVEPEQKFFDKYIKWIDRMVFRR
jgi:hypothetical protein|tara:strand:+ start:185 stop:418 length:234 start_codon:yes stop_codon:yes gene_type:complete